MNSSLDVITEILPRASNTNSTYDGVQIATDTSDNELEGCISSCFRKIEYLTFTLENDNSKIMVK